MMARPTKYTPDAAQRFETALAAGATYRLACGYAGISEDTFAAWRKRYPDFADMLARTDAAAALRWLERIEQAGTDDWRALAWKLERRFPAEFGRTVQQVEVSGPAGGPVPLSLEVRIVDDRAT